MDDQKELFLFAWQVPTTEDSLTDGLIKSSSARNTLGATVPIALIGIRADDIEQMVVGPSHVAFLFKNGHVARLGYSLEVVNKEDTQGDDKQGGGGTGGSQGGGGPLPAGPTNSGSPSGAAASASAAAAANSRSAKIRRVVMAARRSGERGVIVDRSRQLLPASSIPEDLIAQAQVVLQGKSREVIVRELQRTNLNVNEAVNNLLSRDDEDGEDMDETSEAYLPEELLSLLDAGLRSDSHAAAVLDGDNLYTSAEGFDYVVRDIGSRRSATKKTDKSKETMTETITRVKFDERLQYWSKEVDAFPAGVVKFIRIASLRSELIALGDNGSFYGWTWRNSGHGSLTVHHFSTKLLSNALAGEKFVDIVSSAYRACVVTTHNRVASFMDSGTCGVTISNMFLTSLMEIPDGEKYLVAYVCSLYCVVRTQSNSFYWWGIYPFNERRKIFERLRAKARRMASAAPLEVTVGCEVQTKSQPIYTAGSVAVNFNGGSPMIGTLMESAWTLSELCRFRLMTPGQYDETVAEDGSCLSSCAHQPADRKPLNQLGKRGRDDQKSGAGYRETAWSLGDVIFVHKEVSQDTAVVRVVDGNYCGIVYKQPSAPDGAAQNEAQSEFCKLRLMRKDDLHVLSPTNRPPRHPENFRKQLQKIRLPAGIILRKMHAVAIDNTGVRLIVEKRGRLHVLRLSVLGKLQSDHVLPMHPSSVCCTSSRQPHLVNYGDECLTVVSDSNGALVPMARDALGGFREPRYCSLPNIHSYAVCTKPIESTDSSTPGAVSGEDVPSRHGVQTAVLVALLAPSPHSTQPRIPSLLQAVLYCDAQAVELILEALAKEKDCEYVKAEILLSRSDGNRTIIHAAVMNSFARTNKDDVDTMEIKAELEFKWTPKELSTDVDMKAAQDTRASYDRSWQMMIQRTGSAGGQLIRDLIANPLRRPSNVEDVLADIAMSLDDVKKVPVFIEEEKEDTSVPIIVTPQSDPKTRQRNSIEIVKLLCHHAVVAPFLYDLLTTRDVSGHTPFMCAVNVRAYTAAYVIWLAVEHLQRDATVTGSQGKKMQPESVLSSAVFPVGSRPDDSPLFVLCMNDTCSFTWTGDEHINQDIFECRTCGLIGTLCCCTECSNTCHRNHECRLKKTSPTAYCDCWEKCTCRALVAGNFTRRESLLNNLLSRTDMLSQVNSKGEHLLLFLARTVGRQLVEHEQRRKSARTQPAPESVPEHDLEPSKFAKHVFAALLDNYKAVKSVIKLGCKTTQSDALIIEDVFHLNQQHGCSHLDKFVFTLIGKCSEMHLDMLLRLLIKEANKRGAERDPEIDFVIIRFVRSVIRIFTLLSMLSPVAITAAITNASAKEISVSATVPTTRRAMREGVHAMSFTNLLSMVRSAGRDNANTKEGKKKSVTMFVAKCRRVFQTLLSYAISELCSMADTVISPFRMGIVKPTVNIAQSSGDPLEAIGKFLASGVDFRALSLLTEDPAKYTFKRKHSTRHDGDAQEEQESARQTQSAVESDVSSDSDSDEDHHLSETDQDAYSVVDDDMEGDDSGDSPSSPGEEDEDGNELFMVDDDDRDDNDYENSNENDIDDDGEGDDDGDGDGDDEGDGEGEGDDVEAGDGEGDVGEEIVVFSSEVPHAGMQVNSEAFPNEGAGVEDGEVYESAEEVRMEEAESRERMEQMMETDPAEADNIRHSVPLASFSPFPNEQNSNSATQQRGPQDGNRSPDGAPARAESTRQQTENATVNQEQSRSASRRAGQDGNPGQQSTENTASRTSGVTRQTPPISWAIRRVSNHDRFRARNTSATNENENMSAAANTGASPRSRELGDGDHASSSVCKTNQQLAMSFSVLVRLIVDLMPMLVDFRDYKSSSFPQLDFDDDTVLNVRRVISARLNDVWHWMAVVLDRTEAQLRFGNALVTSPVVAAFIRKDRKAAVKKEEHEKRNTRPSSSNRSSTPVPASDFGAPTAAASNGKKEEADQCVREEVFDYMMALMRSHAHENGDDVPIIEFNALRALVFVVDAYLSMIDMLEKVDARIAATRGQVDFDLYRDMYLDSKTSEEAREKGSAINPPIREFFQRSNSMMYPGITASSNGHGFQYKYVESLPLADRPHILKSTSEKEELFGLPTAHRTFDDHQRNSEQQGVVHPAHQSLTEPWSGLKIDFPQTSSTLATQSDQDTAGASGLPRPNVIVHSKTVGSQGVAASEKLRRRTSATSQTSANPPQTATASSVRTPAPPRGFLPIQVDNLMNALDHKRQSRIHRCMSRWKSTLNLMAKSYNEQLLVACGGEISGSVLLSELAGFPVRESQFRKKMEKLRATYTRELSFEVDRDKQTLLAQTMRQLNMVYWRRSGTVVNSGTPPAANVGRDAPRNLRALYLQASARAQENMDNPDAPPLSSHKVKVSFKSEVGEGSGVARSFYTAVADAFLTMKRLPKESEVLAAFSNTSTNQAAEQGDQNQTPPRPNTRRGTAGAFGRRRTTRNRYQLTADSPPFYSRSQPNLNDQPPAPLRGTGDAPPHVWDHEKEALGDRLLSRIRLFCSHNYNKIAGMLLDLPLPQLISIISNDVSLRTHIEDAMELIALEEAAAQAQQQRKSITRAISTPNLPATDEPLSSNEDDTAPLFYRPSKNGFYTPITGKASAHRLACFRNVGRMIGTCMLHMEIFPLHLCRHVFKYILGRPINWYDLAFYDPQLFESLRKLIYDQGPTTAETVENMCLNFEIALPELEGGGMLPLKDCGATSPVTQENAIEYIYLFVKEKLLGRQTKCLEAIKQGVYDVLPVGALDNLTAEDLRLLLCGSQEISMALVQRFTTFTDESKAPEETVRKYKNWFWSICNKMNSQEKQELIFFWTGSPTLPASEDGFQPMPNVMLRPGEVLHLPTANTCINRLYLPVYPSKKILKAKLLFAIKCKTFGFV